MFTGFLPKSAIFSSPTLPQVVTPSPFVRSGLGIRDFTVREWSRLMDLPVEYKDRVIRAFGHYIRYEIPFLFAIPQKILLHLLWVSGVFVTATIDTSRSDPPSSNNQNTSSTAPSNSSQSTPGTSNSASTNTDRSTSDDNQNSQTHTSENTQSLSSGTSSQITNNMFAATEGGKNFRDILKTLLVTQTSFEKTKVTGKLVDVNATKNDSTAVPVFIWNERLLSKITLTNNNSLHLYQSLNVIQLFALICWRKFVRKSLIKYLYKTFGSKWISYLCGTRSKEIAVVLEEVKAGADCIRYAMDSSWWEWSSGSRVFFWRWPPSFTKFAREGIPILWNSNQRPNAKKLQPPVQDQSTKSQMKAKIDSVRLKRYIQPGQVKSLIRFFSVPKGDSDVRMVYDGTASGFNSLVWVPPFGLPTVKTLLRATEPNTWMVDLDIGEQFLNFCLHPDASKYVGIDLTTVLDQDKLLWERYTRCAMGLKTSPNHAIRFTLIAEEFLVDFPWNQGNPFEYSKVMLNLPGSSTYKPSLPWFYVLRKDQHMATSLVIYVDDQRIHAPTQELAYLAARQVASRESYLGIQDAARKRRPPSQQAGAWAGSIIRTNDSEVGLMVSEERWLKTKAIIGFWLSIIRSKPDENLCTKELFSDRGFLVYIARTYEVLTPYLKGIHLTIDGWRQDRDDEGWKIPHYSKQNRNQPTFDNFFPSDYPKSVKPVIVVFSILRNAGRRETKRKMQKKNSPYISTVTSTLSGKK